MWICWLQILKPVLNNKGWLCQSKGAAKKLCHVWIKGSVMSLFSLWFSTLFFILSCLIISFFIKMWNNDYYYWILHQAESVDLKLVIWLDYVSFLRIWKKNLSIIVCAQVDTDQSCSSAEKDQAHIQSTRLTVSFLVKTHMVLYWIKRLSSISCH